MLKLQPTETCPSGTRGRIAVTECLEVTDDIENLILENASEEDIYNTARQSGFMSMKEDAIIKALNHQIPFEEVGAFGTKIGLDEELDDIAAPTPTPLTLDETGAAQPAAAPSDAAADMGTDAQPPVDNLSLDDTTPL